MPPVAAGVDFLQEPAAVFGAMLMLGALLCRASPGNFLSLAPVFVV